MLAEQDLHMMFFNMAHLLSVDLKSYKIYPVERRHFENLLKFLHDVITDVESFSTSNQLSSNNLSAGYAIPELFNAYESHRDAFLLLFDAKKEEDRKEFFKWLCSTLEKYYADQEIDDKLKDLLHLFFATLAKTYTKPSHFERLESVPSEFHEFHSQYAF